MDGVNDRQRERRRETERERDREREWWRQKRAQTKNGDRDINYVREMERERFLVGKKPNLKCHTIKCTFIWLFPKLLLFSDHTGCLHENIRRKVLLKVADQQLQGNSPLCCWMSAMFPCPWPWMGFSIHVDQPAVNTMSVYHLRAQDGVWRNPHYTLHIHIVVKIRAS